MTLSETVEKRLAKRVAALLVAVEKAKPGTVEELRKTGTETFPIAAATGAGIAAGGLGLVGAGGAAAGAAGTQLTMTGILWRLGLLNLALSIPQGIANRVAQEQINKIIPLDELRITALKDIYVNAPDEDTASRAFAALSSTLKEIGIEVPQQRLFLEDAQGERRLVLELLGAVPPGFERRLGETPVQTAKRAQQEQIKLGEEKAKTEAEARGTAEKAKIPSTNEQILRDIFRQETGRPPAEPFLREEAERGNTVARQILLFKAERQTQFRTAIEKLPDQPIPSQKGQLPLSTKSPVAISPSIPASPAFFTPAPEEDIRKAKRKKVS